MVVLEKSPHEIIKLYNAIVHKMEFVQIDVKSCRKGNTKIVDTVICELTPYSSILFVDENGDGKITSISVVGESVQSEEADYYIHWSFLAMYDTITQYDTDNEIVSGEKKLGLSMEGLPKIGINTTAIVGKKQLSLTRDKANGMKLVVKPAA